MLCTIELYSIAIKIFEFEFEFKMVAKRTTLLKYGYLCIVHLVSADDLVPIGGKSSAEIMLSTHGTGMLTH